MYYIVGLGNPGDKYENTRHNVGRNYLEYVAEQFEFSVWEKSKGANALYARGSMEDTPLELLLPETFMNKSGDSVRYLKNKHDVTPEQLILVYDDIDLPLGTFKISRGKGAGGHNGVSSVISAFGSKDFVRIRIGIAGTSLWTGKPKRPSGSGLSRRVLGKFSTSEIAKVSAAYPDIDAALIVLCSDGVAAAMNTYNQ